MANISVLAALPSTLALMASITAKSPAIHPTWCENRRHPRKYETRTVETNAACPSQWIASTERSPLANSAAYAAKTPGVFWSNTSRYGTSPTNQRIAMYAYSPSSRSSGIDAIPTRRTIEKIMTAARGASTTHLRVGLIGSEVAADTPGNLERLVLKSTSVLFI